MKKLTISVSLFCMIALFTGCSEGENVNGQKQIDFSLTQTGDNENWNVTDKITGTYFNIEQMIQGSHDITIQPKTPVDYEEITVSIKTDEKLLGLNHDGESQTEFVAHQKENGSYTIKQNGFTRLDKSEKLWDEDITLIIQHGDKKEKVKLN